MKNTINNNINVSAEHDIQVAGDNDMEKVCKILANAFSNDPVLNWMCGHSKIYYSFFRSEVEALYKHHGHVYINSEQTGAAMWLPAGVSAKPPFHWRLIDVLWKLVSNGGLKSLRCGYLLDKLLADRHPHEPHFYLHTIGSKLENQRRGIGSALLKAALSACDQQCMQAYLESSNEKNNPLYERYGFEIIGDESLPEGGPTIWFMKREVQ
jgi:ribosomal protein S18 acetylase RimI-like enzyme